MNVLAQGLDLKLRHPNVEIVLDGRNSLRRLPSFWCMEKSIRPWKSLLRSSKNPKRLLAPTKKPAEEVQDQMEGLVQAGDGPRW